MDTWIGIGAVALEFFVIFSFIVVEEIMAGKK